MSVCYLLHVGLADPVNCRLWSQVSARKGVLLSSQKEPRWPVSEGGIITPISLWVMGRDWPDKRCKAQGECSPLLGFPQLGNTHIPSPKDCGEEEGGVSVTYAELLLNLRPKQISEVSRPQLPWGGWGEESALSASCGTWQVLGRANSGLGTKDKDWSYSQKLMWVVGRTLESWRREFQAQVEPGQLCLMFGILIFSCLQNRDTHLSGTVLGWNHLKIYDEMEAVCKCWANIKALVFHNPKFEAREIAQRAGSACFLHIFVGGPGWSPKPCCHMITPPPPCTI